MVNPDELCGQQIAAILLFLDSDESACCTGIVESGRDGYSIKGNDFRIPLSPEMLGRVQRIDDPNPEFFEGAAFFVPVSVGRLPDGAEASHYVKTGLQWKSNVGQD